MSISFRFSWHFKREKSVFWKESLFAKQELITPAFMYKTSRLVRISALSLPKKRVLRFFPGKLIYKSNRKRFSCICIAWYKYSRSLENSQVMQTLDIVRTSQVCLTVSNILPTPLVFISGYANTENVSYSLSGYRWFNKAVFTLYRIAFFCRHEKLPGIIWTAISPTSIEHRAGAVGRQGLVN